MSSTVLTFMMFTVLCVDVYAIQCVHVLTFMAFNVLCVDVYDIHCDVLKFTVLCVVFMPSSVFLC